MSGYVWVLDMNWICHWHFHSTGDGASGFDHTLQRIRAFNPEKLFVAEDGNRCFRKQLIDGYKSGRKSKPMALRNDLDQCIINCRDSKIPVLKHDKYEADDILATVAKRCRDAGKVCVLCSADKDLHQLLHQGRVGIYRKTKGDSWHFWSQKDAEKKWQIPRSSFIDYQALMGDSCDSIPGAKGIGAVKARSLILEHGDLAGVKAAVPSMSGAMKKNLEEFFEHEERNVSLVKLVDDVPVRFEV